MGLKVYKFRDIVEMEAFLRGGLVGGVDVSGGVVELVGKVLTFTAPAGAVTFVTASRYNDMLLLKDIKTQVETALGVGNIKVFSIAGKIAFVHPTSASAISFSGNDEPAKRLLGFDQNNSATGRAYSEAGGASPAFVQAYACADNSHVLVTNE